MFLPHASWVPHPVAASYMLLTALLSIPVPFPPRTSEQGPRPSPRRRGGLRTASTMSVAVTRGTSVFSELRGRPRYPVPEVRGSRGTGPQGSQSILGGSGSFFSPCRYLFSGLVVRFILDPLPVPLLVHRMRERGPCASNCAWRRSQKLVIVQYGAHLTLVTQRSHRGFIQSVTSLMTHSSQNHSMRPTSSTSRPIRTFHTPSDQPRFTLPTHTGNRGGSGWGGSAGRRGRGRAHRQRQ